MLKIIFLVSVILCCDTLSYAQADSAEIKKLRLQLGESKDEIDRCKKIGELASQRAQRQLYLYIAQQAALQSLDTENSELKNLTAVQAFNFNKKYQGYEFEGYIHKALTEALKKSGIAFISSPSAKSYSFDGKVKIDTINERLKNWLLDKFPKAEFTCFSHSRRFIAVLTAPNVLKFFNLSMVDETPIVITTNNAIQNFTFSLDDQSIITSELNKQSAKAIYSWPLSLSFMADEICKHISRNMSKEQWKQITRGLPYEKTCPGAH